MVTEQSLVATLRTSIDACNRRDWATTRQLLDPEVVYVTPFSSCVGVEAVLDRYRELTDAVPDLRIERTDIIAVDCHDRHVVFGYTQTGTITKELHTPTGVLRADGAPFNVRSIHVIRFTQTARIDEIRANLYCE